jgi:C4-dicarboxylate transporter, DctM subunit
MIELSPLLILLVLFGAILILVMAGMQIGFALMVIGVTSLIIFPHRPLFQPLAEVCWSQLNSFTLTAVPLFVFMGELITSGKIGEQLYRAAEKWLSHLPGGLANANIGACSVFAALSGSSIATAAAIGSVAIPAMESRGYNPRLIFGSVGAGGTLGILIPPSITMILYGYLGNVSIGKLFIGGVIPGMTLAAAFICYIVLWSLRSPSIAPRLAQRPSLWEMLSSLGNALPSIILILLVLGSIYLGVATPTEAAAVGAFGALMINFFQRQLSFRMLQKCLRSTVFTTAMIGLIMIGAMMVAFALHILRIPIALSEAITASGMNRYLALALVNLLLYVLGCFIDGISIILIMTPILIAMMKTRGFDLVWFGVIFTINIEVSLITPPVGMNLFVLKGIAPRADMSDIIMGTLPYVGILTLGIIALTVWPKIVTWLPNLVMP